LVYFVGNYDYATGYKVINRSRYTKGRYRPEDFELLDALLQRFSVQITTPHVLAEVSNLIKQLPTGADEFCMRLLKAAMHSLEEREVSAVEIAADDAFLDFGVADVSIMKAALTPCLVLTDDFGFSGYMSKNGMDALNFHEIKYGL